MCFSQFPRHKFTKRSQNENACGAIIKGQGFIIIDRDEAQK